jgi:hypothetical protein
MWLPGHGMVRKLFNILSRCVKKVYSQMIPFLCVFFELCSLRCYSSMSTVYMISAKLEHYTCMVEHG